LSGGFVQTLERSVEIDVPLETAFAFFTDIRNHKRLSPSHSQEELVDPGDIPLKLGTTVRLRGKYGGIRWPLASRITAFAPPGQPHADRASFRDEQIHGPFGVWQHDHLLQTLPTGGVRLTDRVQYSAPLWPLGLLVERVWLRGVITDLIQHLQDTAKHILETEEIAALPVNRPPE
jgi:ligand-binding SRPBCC domain-containing protein